MVSGIYTNSLSALRKGRFPLEHDWILKLTYTIDCPLRTQYFTGTYDSLQALTEVLDMLPVVRVYKSYPIDSCPFL